MSDPTPENTAAAGTAAPQDVEMSESTAPSAEAEASTSTETKPEIKQEKDVIVFDEPLPTVEGKSAEEVQILLNGASKQSELQSFL